MPHPPWYETAFGTDYLDRYAHRNEAEAREAIECLVSPLDIEHGARALDLGCGAGRHTASLTERGFRACGFDLSRELLSIARDEAVERPLRASFVRGTMSRLPFAMGSFQLVVNFFTAFGYFEDDSDNLAVFSEIARVLGPGGWFLLDFLNRQRVEAGLSEDTPLVEEIETPEGERCRVIRRLSGKGRRVEKITEWRRGDALLRNVRESVRLFSPGELRAALESRGFAVESEFGSYRAGQFKMASSDRWIALCRRR